MFVVPGLIGLVCEPVIFLLADRYPRAWFVRAGVGAMAEAGKQVAEPPVDLPEPFKELGQSRGALAAMKIAEAVDFNLWPEAEFFEKFRTLNVRSSGQLDELMEQAQRVVRGVGPQQLRDNEIYYHLAPGLGRL